MSISPPTDIVLDVARAADPTRYRQAVAKLDPAAAGTESAFSRALSAQASTSTGQTVPVGQARSPAPTDAGPSSAAEAKARNTAETYRQFEAMALSNLIEASMPSDSSFFGKGVAGDTWKSMLVQQMADQMAKHGGIGIATQMTRSALARNEGEAPAPAAAAMLSTTMERAMLKSMDDGRSDPADPVL